VVLSERGLKIHIALLQKVMFQGPSSCAVVLPAPFSSLGKLPLSSTALSQTQETVWRQTDQRTQGRCAFIFFKGINSPHQQRPYEGNSPPLEVGALKHCEQQRYPERLKEPSKTPG